MNPKPPPYATTPPKLLTPFDRLVRLATRRRSLRGLVNWPAMLPYVDAGLVRALPIPARPSWAVFELTSRGRRKAEGYRSVSAGSGK